MRLALAAFALFTSGNLMAATVSVGVTNDTFLQTDGGSGGIVRGGTSSPERFVLWNYHNGGAWVATPLFFFDLSSYSGQSVSGDATFTVSVSSASGTSTRSLSLVGLTSSFNPQTATHNNTIGTVNGATLDTITTVPVAGGTVTFTIPQATLQGWIDAPSSNYGFGLRPASGTPDIIYFASESGSSTAPTLTFNTVPEPSSAILVGALGVLGLVKRRR